MRARAQEKNNNKTDYEKAASPVGAFHRHSDSLNRSADPAPAPRFEPSDGIGSFGVTGGVRLPLSLSGVLSLPSVVPPQKPRSTINYRSRAAVLHCSPGRDHS